MKNDYRYGIIFKCSHAMFIPSEPNCISIYPCQQIKIWKDKTIDNHCNKGTIKIPWIDYLLLDKKKFKKAKRLLDNSVHIEVVK